MGNGVNIKFAKCLIVFMSICTLIEGLLYLGASIYAIAIKNCATQRCTLVSDSKFAFFELFIYLRDAKCGELVFPNGVLPVMPDVTDVAFRSYIIFIAYACISALWIITSLMVMTALCSVVNKTSHIVCFWPWLLAVIAGSVLDVVATGFHIKDLINTLTGEDLLKYLQVKNADEVLAVLTDYEKYIPGPATVYVCFSSRVVLLWVLNVVGVWFAFSVAKDIVRDNDAKPPHRLREENLAFENSVNPQVQRLPQTQEIREIGRSPSPEYEVRRREIRTLEPLKSVETTAVVVAQAHDPPRQEAPDSNRVQMRREPSEISNKRVQELKPRNSGVSGSSLTYIGSDPEHLDYTNRNEDYLSTEISELSADSPLNARYSHNLGLPLHAQPHVTEGYRNQVPWSYINFKEDLQARKQVLSHTPKHDDFTLHPPKEPRHSIQPDKSRNMSKNNGINGEGPSRW